jgi:hypothetical protein
LRRRIVAIDLNPATYNDYPSDSQEGDESWSLIQELDRNRNAYRKPSKGEESFHLKLTLPYQEQIKRLCSRVSLGPFGKAPGMQPALFASIVYGLGKVETWEETRELINSAERRKNLPDDTDKEIASEISRFAEGLKIHSAPTRMALVNVVLDSETGSRLVTLARAMDTAHHGLAVLCILEALSVQPLGVIEGEMEDIRAHLAKVRKQLHTSAWCAGALMDKLEREQTRGHRRRE